MTYRIITTTDLYTGSRYSNFHFTDCGHLCYRIDAEGLSLEGARKELERLAGRGKDEEFENGFSYDTFTTRIELETGNRDTVVSPKAYTDRDIKRELNAMLREGVEILNEDDEPFEDSDDILDAWRRCEDVKIGDWWLDRLGFIESRLIYKEI